MGLLTNGNSEFQRGKIQRFDLARYFESIVIESEFGAGKPDQRVFRAALEQMDALPTQAWMIGDDLMRDIQPAQLLGMGTVWVDIENSGLPASSPIVPMLTVHAVADLVEG